MFRLRFRVSATFPADASILLSPLPWQSAPLCPGTMHPPAPSPTCSSPPAATDSSDTNMGRGDTSTRCSGDSDGAAPPRGVSPVTETAQRNMVRDDKTTNGSGSGETEAARRCRQFLRQRAPRGKGSGLGKGMEQCRQGCQAIRDREKCQATGGNRCIGHQKCGGGQATEVKIQ